MQLGIHNTQGRFANHWKAYHVRYHVQDPGHTSVMCVWGQQMETWGLKQTSKPTLLPSSSPKDYAIYYTPCCNQPIYT